MPQPKNRLKRAHVRARQKAIKQLRLPELGVSEIRERIRGYFKASRALIDTDEIERDLRATLLAELRALEGRLLDTAPTFLALAVRHKLHDVAQLVDVLVDARCRQLFRKPRVFEWNARRLASLPKKLDEARAFLDDASPLLSQVFASGVVEAMRLARTHLSPGTHSVPREPPFEGDGRSLSDIRVAVRVLERALAAMNTLPFRSWADNYSRSVFGSGPRRTLDHEAATARKLIVMFRAETGKPLYAYVGSLLAATFPAVATGSACKRPQDYVKQLLRQYPAPP